MKTRRLVALALLFWVLGVEWQSGAGPPVHASSAARRLPNFIIIYADDLGYADIGSFDAARGATRPRTPNLDRMAAEGIRLTHFYVAQAVCSASRMALLTGIYPNRVGITGALNHTARHGINPDEMTIAEVLKQRDYATAIYGKWHLGHEKPFLPVRHGFDEYFGLPYSNDMWPRHPQQKGFYPDLPLIEGDQVVELDPDQSQLTTRYTERAVRFIERNRDKPFFLYVAHTMPHVPLFASGKFRGTTARGLYGDVMAEIDWSTGRILDAVKRAKLDNDTLVIFTSDNGPWLSYGNHAGSAGPLREGKATAFEGGVRVPFVARWPATWRPSARSGRSSEPTRSSSPEDGRESAVHGAVEEGGLTRTRISDRPGARRTITPSNVASRSTAGTNRPRPVRDSQHPTRPQVAGPGDRKCQMIATTELPAPS